MENLKYKDETDRAYGLTGMAVSLMVWEADGVLDAVDLDAPVNSGMRFTPDFYFGGSPSVSAKASWEHQVERFRLNTAMILANVMCRRLVNGTGPVNEKLRAELLSMICEEGEAACSLGEDESAAVFGKCYAYCERIFSHLGVKRVVRDCVGALASRRVLHRSEMMELLAPIGRL